jgi:phosphatidylserine/phosphatidylglycerophosphate/cardiolipin synthase-like enzyme
MLAGRTRIHIRVKRGDPREYMHCKEVLVDGMVLRDGSANWSRSALEFQDNSWFLITNRPDILRFRRHFERMWNRPSNLVIQ